MKLINNWKQIHKFRSTQILAISTILQTTWMSMPEDLKAYIPTYVPETIAIIIFACGIMGRMIKQELGGHKPHKLNSKEG